MTLEATCALKVTERECERSSDGLLELPVSVNSYTAAVLIHHFAPGNIIGHTKRVAYNYDG